jgi:2-iminobutanoate/2-iminopropanoate deaminase
MNNRTFITSGNNVPKVTAPISQAIVAGNYCHISGQLATNLNGEFVGGTIHEQASIAFNNLFAILEAAHFTKEDIVFIDMAFTDLNDLATITPYYDSLFEQGKKPARTIYQAAALPFGGSIKVMAVAIKTN